MVKMVLTDLDHTLLRQDGSISEASLEVISACRRKGIKLAIATARYWIGAERYIRLLKPDYEITTDGTLIHAEDACIYSKAFSIEDTNRIVRSVKARILDTEISVAHGKTVFWNSKHIAESERLHKAIYNDYSRDLEVGANKIAAVLPDEQMAKEIADEIGCKLQCYRGENMYAFLPAGSGKIQAIEALSKQSGIAISDIVAFGDDKNDIDMLTMCGKGVAVANAIPEVLAVADEITASNDEDGVAEWMRKNCLS